MFLNKSSSHSFPPPFVWRCADLSGMDGFVSSLLIDIYEKMTLTIEKTKEDRLLCAKCEHA